MADETRHKKFWETLLLYPPLLVALGGGLGTVLPVVWSEWKAYKLGVTTARLHQVEAQSALWTKNVHCLAMRPVYTITISEGVEVGVILCSSGDALLKNPITGVGCARAACGHAAAEPISAMNARRLTAQCLPVLPKE